MEDLLFNIISELPSIVQIVLLGVIFPLVAIFLSFYLFKLFLRHILGPLTNRATVFVADRYLFSRTHRNAINIITFIAVLGITYVTAALITVLSIFNGFQDLVENMYTSFDPDVRIVAARGKTITHSDELLQSIMDVEGVEYVSPAIQDKAMLSYFDKQYMVEVKGVKPDYLRLNPLDSLVYEGQYAFSNEIGHSMSVLGGSVAYFINARISDRIHPMQLWAAGDAKASQSNPEKAVRSESLFTAGYFKVQMEYDTRYILVDFELARRLFDLDDRVSSYDVKVKDFGEAEAVKEALQAKLGSSYRVETWFDMHQSLFNVMKNEKLVAYLILTLMLIIAAVNVVGSLSMIIVEKTRDIAILKSMGASRKMVRQIFLLESLLVGGIGGMAGMSTAFVIGYLQENAGLVPMNGGESFTSGMDYFPHEMWLGDFVLIFATIFCLSLLAGLYPSKKAADTAIVQSLRK